MVLNFDNDKNAVINPSDMSAKLEGMPETVVIFFDSKIMDYFLKNYKYEELKKGTEITKHPIYKVNKNGREIGVFLTGIGAPLCIVLCEDLVAMGAKNILAFGSCGVLIDLKEASIILPNRAVRDEGTSYHYAPASEEIDLDEKYINRLVELCKESNIDYTIGKTWTTDALYRETRGRVKERVEEGCICVDMECSALTAFAKFREINFAQFFYAADSLAKEDWDVRILQTSEMKGEEIALALAIDWATKLFN